MKYRSLTMSFTVCLAVSLTLFTTACSSTQAQPMTDTESVVAVDTGTGILHGTLLVADTPANSTATQSVALIIAGSGPTDRNGNNPRMTNNSLRMLAHGLSDAGISSLRYDKRGIAKSKQAATKESDLRFEHYIDDASSWIDYLAEQDSFEEIVVIGHSEGALIGMIASQHDAVSKFVSLAGPGRNLDEIIREQLGKQPPELLKQATPILDKLKNGEAVDDVPVALKALFRSSVQPYMISQLKYDPAAQMGKLNKPALVVQGTTDIQINEKDADRLADKNDNASKVVIEGMNHILKSASADRKSNIKTYDQPDLPITAELFDALKKFLSN